MTDEQILRWLLEWGMNEVDVSTLYDSWAKQIQWHPNANAGLLERKEHLDTITYKLTSKALERIK